MFKGSVFSGLIVAVAIVYARMEGVKDWRSTSGGKQKSTD